MWHLMWVAANGTQTESDWGQEFILARVCDGLRLRGRWRTGLNRLGTPLQ